METSLSEDLFMFGNSPSEPADVSIPAHSNAAKVPTQHQSPAPETSSVRANVSNCLYHVHTCFSSHEAFRRLQLSCACVTQSLKHARVHARLLLTYAVSLCIQGVNEASSKAKDHVEPVAAVNARSSAAKVPAQRKSPAPKTSSVRACVKPLVLCACKPREA